MIKKITDKDKEDWENFLNNKKKNLNKNSIKKRDIRNLDKDKQDWENFLNNKEKIPNKDFIHKKNVRYEKIKKIDLHGYTIEEANKAIEQFIQKCFDENVTKIIVITGKGLRSKNIENPYLSKDLSILKYSVPEFIEKNRSLTQFIIETTDAKIEDSLEVTVDFVSEIITCIKDKDKKIVSGDTEKIKTVYDTWVFSKDIKSSNPNWLLINTIT